MKIKNLRKNVPKFNEDEMVNIVKYYQRLGLVSPGKLLNLILVINIYIYILYNIFL